MNSIKLSPDGVLTIRIPFRRGPEEILRLIVGLLLLFLVISGLLYRVLSLDILSWLPGFSFCPFKFITGHPCPGCGMLRSLIRLGQLEFASAFAYHPFGFVLLPFMIGYMISYKINRLISTRIAVVMLISVILLWIARLANPELLLLAYSAI